VTDLETCRRCRGTGVGPDPDGEDRESLTADGPVGTLVILLLDWITPKILALRFPKLRARCRYCRGAGSRAATERGRYGACRAGGRVTSYHVPNLTNRRDAEADHCRGSFDRFSLPHRRERDLLEYRRGIRQPSHRRPLRERICSGRCAHEHCRRIFSYSRARPLRRVSTCERAAPEAISFEVRFPLQRARRPGIDDTERTTRALRGIVGKRMTDRSTYGRVPTKDASA
jgi:hypothetical protein